jgi:hypothetical protein
MKERKSAGATMTDPLTEPAKGTPYWLRDRNLEIEKRHLDLIKKLYQLYRVFKT